MNILVTLDSNYVKPLKVMLTSLFFNNPGETFSIYLFHSRLTLQEIDGIRHLIEINGHRLHVVTIDESYFREAPILLHYPKEMYYRLLAFKFLPRQVDRILYLDPDILVINRVRELYQTDLEGYLFAAAYHDFISIKEINRIRLMPYKIDAYYNSGVLLINLDLQRKTVSEDAIYEFVEKNRSKLIMPDQDIMNALFSKQIKSIDEKRFNYDARYYEYYKLKTNGLWDMDRVFQQTVIVHFCGRKKPWNKKYNGKFLSLYKQYEKIAAASGSYSISGGGG